MKEKGYNLIEVIIAMGILAWVLLAVAGLFSWGTRGVYSGKTQTKAAALAQKIVEDLRNFDTRTKRYAVFGAASTDTTITISFTDDAPPAALSDTLLQAVRDNWLDQLAELPGTATNPPSLDCTIGHIGGTNFGSATFLSYNLSINWIEVDRNRNLTFHFTF